ncbi:hypothetical protein KMZ32_08560 [Phycicoccus sp. MAQZ13P-2]|uniref:hypothetical protein n=1 Tax=Phycicoccus mangrovi TaxID=2840470 RepID=UPI001C006A0B|nr:hypothetical protein [Phycicoccus mangrovi]MBT9255137.1 hypothetical protein [Phycicoccus mangrovi]MBT9274121.1 hypothetical protein [Phycicoccus mangrovi]
MNLEMITTALRWTFWSILYLGVALTSMVVVLGMAAPYAPFPVRLAVLGGFFLGIALDVRHKLRSGRPDAPTDGEPVRVTRRR